MKLRPHQKTLENQIIKAVQRGHKKILLSCPTGWGKTVQAFSIAQGAINKGNRVLFTTHRITLAEQTFKVFDSLKPELLQGDNKINDEDSLLIIATIQTLLNTDIKEPKIILIDEVHYAYEGELIQSLFTKFPNAIFIGLSATPVDNNDHLLDGFDIILDEFQTEDLIKLGYLTPFDCHAPFEIDTSSVRSSNNEFNNKELEGVINKIDINASIVREYINIGEERTFICFAVNQKHCKDLKIAFDNAGVKTKVIDSNTSKDNRDKYFKQLRSKELSGLISIEILTAGFDEPIVSCILMATKTMQWKKYIQCAGRGIRILGQNIEESITNGKRDCMFLDFCGNIEMHGMPDERKIFKFGKKISKVLDRELSLDIDNDVRNNIDNVITEEKQVYLKRIGKLLDLYDGKVYTKESDLQTDVTNYLKRTGKYYWRQNSGVANIQGRWVRFASKSGLPDNTVFYDNTTLYFGLELKLPHGRLTRHQKVTLPEMAESKVLFFIIESVYEVYKAIEHLENNTIKMDEGLFVKNSLYDLPIWEVERRDKFNIPLY